ncbi:MAG: hypothetical protein ACLQOZ_15640 [Acidimicrobiales bacterium]|jgi:hypothetical protein
MAAPAEVITAALLAPATAEVSTETRLAVRDRLLAAAPGLVERLPPGEQVVLTIALLRQLGRATPGPVRTDEPFAWKPAFVRRSLGLAAVEACLAHRFRAPAEAVGPVAAQAVAEWERSGWRTFHWEPWLATLGGGARSAVLAEATTWASTLWTSLDWGQFRDPPRLGGPDDQWVCAASRTVRLKGRSEVRAFLPARPGRSRAGPLATAMVSMAGGTPRPGCEVGLGYLALVAALRSPSRPAPARVIGIWPDAGQHRVVDVTDRLLMDAGELVLTGVAAVVDSTTGPSVDPAVSFGA